MLADSSLVVATPNECELSGAWRWQTMAQLS